MKTYLLAREEIRAYIRDFLQRLERWSSPPTLWCSVTKSGRTFLAEILAVMGPDHPLTEKTEMIQIDVRDGKQVLIQSPERIRGQSVLLRGRGTGEFC